MNLTCFVYYNIMFICHSYFIAKCGEIVGRFIDVINNEINTVFLYQHCYNTMKMNGMNLLRSKF